MGIFTDSQASGAARPVRAGLLTIAALLMLVGGDAAALQSSDQDAAYGANKRGEILPYIKLKKQLERSFRGEIVGQRLRRMNTRWVYEIRMLQSDGRVSYLIVDASSGKVIRRSKR